MLASEITTHHCIMACQRGRVVVQRECRNIVEAWNAMGRSHTGGVLRLPQVVIIDSEPWRNCACLPNVTCHSWALAIGFLPLGPLAFAIWAGLSHRQCDFKMGMGKCIRGSVTLAARQLPSLVRCELWDVGCGMWVPAYIPVSGHRMYVQCTNIRSLILAAPTLRLDSWSEVTRQAEQR